MTSREVQAATLSEIVALADEAVAKIADKEYTDAHKLMCQVSLCLEAKRGKWDRPLPAELQEDFLFNVSCGA